MKQFFNYKKSLGQNFLHDENIIHKIVESANITKDSLVIEIGPGQGALTKYIVPLAGNVLLYELDSRLEGYLNQLLSKYHNFSLKIIDFLKINLKDELKNDSYKNLLVVANLPYYITTPIIMKFIDEGILPDEFIIMVQKEVASRLSATVGSKDYGALTVLLNYYYDISKLFDVSRNCFTPKPNVDSTVISMKLKKNRYSIINFDFFQKIVRDSFSYKRKTLRNNLKNYDLEVIESVLQKYGFNLNVRAEMLELVVFVDIANTLAKLI